MLLADFRPLLDLTIHRYPSSDGRHWSSPEMAEYHDGKIGNYIHDYPERY